MILQLGIEWLTRPEYSPLEVTAIVLLAALPLSQIAQILLGVLEKKTGIKTSGFDTPQYDSPDASGGDDDDDGDA